MKLTQLLEQNNIGIVYDIDLDINVPEGTVLLLNGRYNDIEEYNKNLNLIKDKPSEIYSLASRVYKNWRENDQFVQRFVIERILPREKTEEQLKIMEMFFHVYLEEDVNCHNGLRMEYYEKIEKQRKETARLLYIEMDKAGEPMSMECFNAILEHCGNPDYIIVSNDFVYEHLPLDGKPKDIHTSEGIVEAWEIDGVTIFYMPLRGNMSNEDIILWHNVLTEIFK